MLVSGACKLKFDQLYFINELQGNDVLLPPKILLGYGEVLWPKKLDISHASQILTMSLRFWFFLSYLITTVSMISRIQLKLTK